MGVENALDFLRNELKQKEKRTNLNFKEYLELVRENPQRTLRNVFQLFYDMVKCQVRKEEDKYTEDPESIGFVKYDCSKLFVEGSNNPFFADTLFANRFVRQIESLKQGSQQNRVYVYDGSSGSGKSTFLNNLLRSFEAYTKTPEGQSLEILWEIDMGSSKKLLIPCPSRDYPILIIPKKYRTSFLDQLLGEETKEEQKIKNLIFNEKEYEWLFREEVCTICKSILSSLTEKLGSWQKASEMVNIRPCRFDRRIGEGISIFNPGDPQFWGINNGPAAMKYFTNKQIQEQLDDFFGINAIRYFFSPLAKTNNGIYVLMDIKFHNKGRLLELHNVLSEGVHKVGEIEENVHSLFFALMNPEDKTLIEEERMESFQERIQYNHITYVLEPETEEKIYLNSFGKAIGKRFQPGVLKNFARIIVSSRMEIECPPMEEWIPEMKKYKRYCDEHGLLLRMEIYNNHIPAWLSEEDRKKFTTNVRKAIIGFGQDEGSEGFTGRESLTMFSDFFSRYAIMENLINMNNVIEFFKHGIDKKQRDDNLPPKGFLGSIIDSYDYEILSEIKEAIYFYSKDQIKKDILNYLCAINYDIGDTINCKYTGEEMEVTMDFFQLMAGRISGKEVDENEALSLAQEVQKKYIITIASKNTKITETELYRDLFEAYVYNLKEKALTPFVSNKNFREAIKAYGSEEFQTFDVRLKEHVSHMIENLVKKFGYSERGAKEICIYILDKNLVQKFS